MIISEIQGGLGNQMFQYAAGRALALRLGKKYKLDLSWFAVQPATTPRCFMLDVFSLSCPVASPAECRLLMGAEPLWARCTRVLASRPRTVFGPCYIKEPHAGYWPGFMQVKSSTYLSGYWQNELYFASARKQLRSEFVFPPLPSAASALAARIKAEGNPTVVHVRRGDYVADAATNAVHGVCPPEYYAAALAHIKQYAPDATLFLFSDDPSWVRANFDTHGLPATVVHLHGEDDAHHDMHLMTLCKNHVIANSSFSWWGAWLAAQGGLTLAPRLWFTASSMRHDNPCPKRWMCL